jgi:hypothetical protein
MMKAQKFLKELVTGLFPPRLNLLPQHLQLVRILFPSQKGNRVTYRGAMPWFMFAKPKVNAVTLPRTFGLRGMRIYFRSFKLFSPPDIALFVHEHVHVQQAQGLIGGIGLGMFTPFVIRYLAEYYRSGYRDNSMERDAYDFEAKVESYLAQLRKAYPDDDVSFLNALVERVPADLVNPTAHHKRRANALQLVAGFFTALGAMVGRPLAELILIILLGPLWLLTRLASRLSPRRP